MPTKRQDDTTTTETPLDRARAKYESEKRGADAIRIKLTQNDEEDKWNNIKANLIEHHGSVKQGVYDLAEAAGYLKKPKKKPEKP